MTAQTLRRLRKRQMRSAMAGAQPWLDSCSAASGRPVFLALLTTAAALCPRTAFACPVCFGATDTPMLRGSSMGILALLVVTAAMLGAFGWFFRTLARRERDAMPLAISETADARRSEI